MHSLRGGSGLGQHSNSEVVSLSGQTENSGYSSELVRLVHWILSKRQVQKTYENSESLIILPGKEGVAQSNPSKKNIFLQISHLSRTIFEISEFEGHCGGESKRWFVEDG